MRTYGYPLYDSAPFVFVYGRIITRPGIILFKIMLSGGELPVPSPCLALFQFVYVKDIAKFLLACIGNQSVTNKSYNLSAPELISYEAYPNARQHNRCAD